VGDLRLPEFEIDPNGTYAGANPEAAALVGRRLEDVVGARIGSFTRHETVDDPGRRAWAVLAAQGYLESTAVVVRPDGDAVPVRYRITGSADAGYRKVMSST
jgi:PAS domain-containing protein